MLLRRRTRRLSQVLGREEPGLTGIWVGRSVLETMKVTVEISEDDLRHVLEMTGEKKKGPAIAKLVEESVRLERRRLLAGQVLAEGWRCELPDWQEGRKREREGSVWGS